MIQVNKDNRVKNCPTHRNTEMIEGDASTEDLIIEVISPE